MLITFEGIEGSGKSTQSRWLYEYLQKNGFPVLLTREPGGTKIGQKIREILLNQKSDLSSCAELLLYMSDRAQHVQKLIKPALAEGKIVLTDRYIDSTIAYQVFGRGLDAKTVKNLNDLATDGNIPDVTFLFDLEAKEGLARAQSRNSEQGTQETEGRFEALDLEFHQRVRNGYLETAFTDPDARFRIIDASPSPEIVFAKMLKAYSENVRPIKDVPVQGAI